MKNLKKLLTDNRYLLIFTVLVLLFFYPFIVFGKIPIPADTIVGMYHPWRDVIWDDITSGVPFKNFLITDPVRQQYVWRMLAIEELKKGNLPLWNPYSFSGTPLMANFQSASLYPLNILFFILPFNLAWGILVMLQPLLAGFFLYLYLRLIKVSQWGSLVGAITFAFSGFSIAWLEWNTIGHVVAWLPLTLLAIEKIINYYSSGNPDVHRENREVIQQKVLDSLSFARTIKLLLWSFIFTFSLVFSFFAGHLQIFFYSFLITIFYAAIKIMLLKKDKMRMILLFVICYLLFVILTSIQWLPTLQFILSSARDFDQGSWMKPGWFIPWQNLTQFIVPDFFGNPATDNYWGIWNYVEFIGYIGIIPLIFALYALIVRRDKKTIFFGALVLVSLIFATPTPLAKLPYQLHIPFISTSQPTRLLFLTDFALSILAALGFDYFLENINYTFMVRFMKVIGGIGVIYGVLWLFVLSVGHFGIPVLEQNIFIAKRNLILPTTLFILSATLLSFRALARNLAKRNLMTRETFSCFLLFIVLFDLFHFGWKFTPFSKSDWIFPETKLIGDIKKESQPYRLMSLDRRIMPPNFSASYCFQDVAGYDPLYLKNYGQLVAAWERNRTDITPANFNRIITPNNAQHFLTNLLGVKYLLSFQKLPQSDFTLLGQEGQTYLYENKKVIPRTFLVEEVVNVDNSQQEMETMFRLADKLRFTAVTSQKIQLKSAKLTPDESAEIIEYQPNKIILQVKTNFERMVVLTDIYYPAWQAVINGKKTEIYPVDFTLRGIVVPAGENTVILQTSLL